MLFFQIDLHKKDLLVLEKLIAYFGVRSRISKNK